MDNLLITNYTLSSSQINTWIKLSERINGYNSFEVRNQGLGNSLIDNPLVEVIYDYENHAPSSSNSGVVLGTGNSYKVERISPYYIWARVDKGNTSIELIECRIKDHI